VRFIVDDQLPPALARLLADSGHEAQHVSEAGLTGADDRKIWKHAKAIASISVSKDRDFTALQVRDPDGQAVVWVRMGNTRKQVLLERFRHVLPVLIMALEAGQKVIEVE
jgi:predicted nuclease of predicted toxin-antitoxin system